MKSHTTPLPAAAICAVVGSGIGVALGALDGVAVGAVVGVAVGVLAAAVAVGVALGVDAAGAHALRRMRMNAKTVFLTLDLHEDERRGVPRRSR
jgi:hypothetical protein